MIQEEIQERRRIIESFFNQELITEKGYRDAMAFLDNEGKKQGGETNGGR